MFNHVSVGTRDLERATRFYDAALGALGYRRTMSEVFGCACGLEWPEFWASSPPRATPGRATASTSPSSRASREAVDAFHAAALAGAEPTRARRALRDYTADYYAAFVRDPDGNKLEAVHLPYVPFPEK